MPAQVSNGQLIPPQRCRARCDASNEEKRGRPGAAVRAASDCWFRAHCNSLLCLYLYMLILPRLSEDVGSSREVNTSVLYFFFFQTRVARESPTAQHPLLERLKIYRSHKLLGGRNDAVDAPSRLGAVLEVEDVADLVACAEQEVNVGLGVRRRETEAHARGNEGCGTRISAEAYFKLTGRRQ